MNRQNRQTKTGQNGRPRREHLYLFPLLLAAILAALFAKSFLPGYVHFSNDGPLGQVNAQFGRMPGVLTGIWTDLNDIGTSGGTISPNVTAFMYWFLGPVDYSKFYQPLCLFILGLGAWVFFRQLKLSPLAATLGALGAALNSSWVGNACWGTASVQIAMGMVFLALGLVMANSDETPRMIRWSRLALAGMAVGFSVMEGADNGAIFSLFVAAFVFFKSLVEDGAPTLKNFGRGIARVSVIAIFAAFLAAQTISSLVQSAIVGTAGMQQNKSIENSLEHWDWATQWSLPKKETIAVFVPGVFGYRMDTPKDMMDFLQSHYEGGEYWGGMGRTPELDRWFDSGMVGPEPSGPADWMRFGYAGLYCGILVAVVALFAMLQSLRGANSIFPAGQRHLIWFWMAALVMTLLLSWGRFAPFYHFIYILPYFSTIRNPAKFMAIFYLAMIIIFAYGIDGLVRRYMQEPTPAQTPTSTGKAISLFGKLTNWWAGNRGFDRNWTLGSLAVFVLSVLGWLVYSSQTTNLVHYLEMVGFPDPGAAGQIASFSIGQVGWFLPFLAAALILVVLVITGTFSGKRARIGGVLLVILLVADLGRANLPWIIHWNYMQKYEIDPSDPTKSTNPIINLLSDKPYEHRVADLQSESPFESLYRIEWMQHHFPFYNIQCLDVIQSPRVASDLAAYDMALIPSPTRLYLVARKWALSNTSYLLGPAGYLDSLNQELDPVQRRFHIVQRFTMVPKPGIDTPQWPDQETVKPDANGDFALFDFSGALPRAKLYSNWQVSTNDDATLQTLAAPDFNPQKTVLVSNPMPDPSASGSTDQNTGTVDYKSYAPKDFVLAARADKPSVLLVNDKFDPGWHVFVDGKPAEIFRANFIMRGVFLPAGSHTVEFQFRLPNKPMYITWTAIFLGFVLLGILYVVPRQRRQALTKPLASDKPGRAAAGSVSTSSKDPSSSRR